MPGGGSAGSAPLDRCRLPSRRLPVSAIKLRQLLAALGLLTVLPLPRPDADSAAFAASTVFFPVVGLLLGVVLVALRWCAGQQLPPWPVALVLLVAWEGLSGTVLRTDLPWRGLPVRPAAFGLCLVAKAACLAQQAGGQAAALLFAPLLGRWAMVVLAVGARDAAAPARKFNPAITFQEFALTSVFSCGVLLLTAEAFGVLLIVCVAALCLVLRWLSQRLGGVSWPRLVGGAQLTELLVLLLFSLLAHH